MDKRQLLSNLKLDLESRKDIPLIKSPADVVFGDGNPESSILLIGEAAGYWESIERKPFVGQSGKLLIKILNEILGIDRKDVYITNIVKARPPDNRDPLPEEIEVFRPYLDKEIEIIEPKIIVTLGRFSMAKFLPDAKISQVHGQGHEIVFQDQKYYLVTMYHPAFAIRGTSNMMEFKNDFGKLRQMAINALKLRRC
jgi:DNA polymerase